MTIADSRVVGWQWEHFVNNGLGDGYWIDQSGHEYPEILDQSDLKDPNKYRNMTALVPLTLLAEAESRIVALQSRLDAVVRLADKYRELSDGDVSIGESLAYDEVQDEIRSAALGGESPLMRRN